MLAPVREDLVDLITPGSTLLDVGSGTGDLLFRSASVLTMGCGIDIDEGMTNFAEEKRNKEGIGNIKFICSDFRSIERNNYDYQRALFAFMKWEFL